jgi:hypothetical protein
MNVRWTFKRFAISMLKLYIANYILNYLSAVYIFILTWLSYLHDKLICEGAVTVSGVGKNFVARSN